MLLSARAAGGIQYGVGSGARSIRANWAVSVRSFSGSVHTRASRKLFEIVKAEVPEFQQPSSAVPILTIPRDVVVECVKSLPRGKKLLVERESTLFSHNYVCVSELGNLAEISASTGIPVAKLKAVIGNPMFWVDAWFLNVPFGGAEFRTARPSTTTAGSSADLNLMGANVWPFTDIIRASHISQELFTPENLNAILALEPLPYRALHHAFLARTLWGHALIGSVSHNFLDLDQRLFAAWYGCGFGMPIGGRFNNIVACNEQVGTWPRLALNLREAFMMKDFWTMLDAVYQHETAEAQFAALLQLARWVERNRTWASWGANKVGIVHTSAGFPQRLGSAGYGEVIKALAYLRGEPHTNLKSASVLWGGKR